MTKAFVLPFVLYLLGTTMIGRLGESWYPIAYAAVVAVVMGSLFWSLKIAGVLRSGALRPSWRVGQGVLVGVVGIVVWIWLSHLRIEQQIGQYLPDWMQPSERVGYNPWEELSGAGTWLFIAVRLLGLAVAVPLAEELFWRGFLLRWLIDPDWEDIPIGKFTFGSCMIVTGMFAAAHPELIAAAIYCLMINGLLYRSKDLWQCVVAHAVSNLILGIYVLMYGQWWLW